MASVSETRINSNFRSHALDDDEFIHFVLGEKLEVVYPDDLSTFTIQKESVYLPPNFFDFVYENSQSLAMSSSVCSVHEFACPQEYAYNGYTDVLDCVEKMESLPFTTTNTAGINTVDSNSTGCRQLHSSMAAVSPEIHCPHLSFVPMEDTNGKTKCSVSSDFAFEDYFSQEDFVLFQRTAQMNQIDHKTFLNGSAKKGICSDTAVSKAAIESSRGLPEHIRLVQ